MMLSLEELQNKWDSIDPLTGGFLLVSSSNKLSFHIGHIGMSNKCLMVSGVFDKQPIVSSVAITADYVMLDSGKLALKFVLNYPSLDEVFIKLCWDLMNVACGNENAEEAILQRFKSWMKLFQKGANSILSVNQQKGLIGEILFLEEKMHDLGENKAIEAWVGPEGADQDFVFMDSWSEIKTTTIASESITISSVQQLGGIFPGELVVYFMDKTSANGKNVISLPILVERVKSNLSTNNQNLFMCKLALLGYLDKDSDIYINNRFNVKEKRTYNVNVSFPKLTPYNLPSEIVNARYELSLAAIDRFRLN